MIEDAIILLAGLGSRLKPLTDNTHKALIEIGGTTILARQIEALTEFGIRHFHLALGYRASDIQNYIQKNFPHLSVTYYDNPVFASTNTAYSLFNVIQKMPKGFLLLDGDVVFQKSLLNHFHDQPAANLLLCETDPHKLDPEAVKFRTNELNEIVEIGKQIALKQAAGESIGIGQFQAAFSQLLCEVLKTELQDTNHANWYYEDAFQKMLNAKLPFAPLIVQSTEPHPWVEVDDFKDLQAAQLLFA